MTVINPYNSLSNYTLIILTNTLILGHIKFVFIYSVANVYALNSIKLCDE